MIELGEGARGAHVEAGRLAASLEVDALVAVGEFSEATAEGALRGGMEKERVVCAGGNEEALYELRALLGDIDTVLVKGSRSMRMEEIVEGLKKQEGVG